jgi:hypothetical protein
MIQTLAFFFNSGQLHVLAKFNGAATVSTVTFSSSFWAQRSFDTQRTKLNVFLFLRKVICVDKE